MLIGCPPGGPFAPATPHPPSVLPRESAATPAMNRLISFTCVRCRRPTVFSPEIQDRLFGRLLALARGYNVPCAHCRTPNCVAPMRRPEASRLERVNPPPSAG